MHIISFIGLIIFISFFCFQVMYLAVTILKTKAPKRVDLSLEETKMSILIPAYNEESVLANCLNGLEQLNYDNFEAIFINDGSTDNSMNLLHDILSLVPINMPLDKGLIYQPVKAIYRSTTHSNILVIDKYNGGKADALNAGIDYADGDIVVTLDADSILHANSFLHINAEFQDEKVIAAGGMVHVGQMFNREGKATFRGKGLLKNQLSDYLTSFYTRKFTQSKLNVLAIVSGAFGVFRRDVLMEIGGYKKSLGEDMEITLNIQRLMHTTKQGFKMIFIPEAICYTEVPENFGDLFKQRVRWQKGFMDCMVKYKRDMFRTLSKKFSIFLLWDSLMVGFSGAVSLVIIPLILLFGVIDSLFIYCATLSFIAQIALRITSYWSASIHGYQYKFHQYIHVLLFSILEIPTYRLLDVFFFAYGSLGYFIRKDKHNWNKVKRLGNVVVKSS